MCWRREARGVFWIIPASSLDVAASCRRTAREPEAVCTAHRLLMYWRYDRNPASPTVTSASRHERAPGIDAVDQRLASVRAGSESRRSGGLPKGRNAADLARRQGGMLGMTGPGSGASAPHRATTRASWV